MMPFRLGIPCLRSALPADAGIACPPTEGLRIARGELQVDDAAVLDRDRERVLAHVAVLGREPVAEHAVDHEDAVHPRGRGERLGSSLTLKTFEGAVCLSQEWPTTVRWPITVTLTLNHQSAVERTNQIYTF